MACQNARVIGMHQELDQLENIIGQRESLAKPFPKGTLVAVDETASEQGWG